MGEIGVQAGAGSRGLSLLPVLNEDEGQHGDGRASFWRLRRYWLVGASKGRLEVMRLKDGAELTGR